MYKVKYKTHGEMECYKARLVIKAYLQKVGIDYEETYAPIIKHDLVRAMFVVATSDKMHIVQFDIGLALLNGDLDEGIYRMNLEGFKKKKRFVCRLKKNLYGWNKLQESGKRNLIFFLRNMIR